MGKYLVRVDKSEAYRGYMKPEKHIVVAKSLKAAAIKVLKKDDLFEDSSLSYISRELQSEGDGEYYVDGFGGVEVTLLSKEKKKKKKK